MEGVRIEDRRRREDRCGLVEESLGGERHPRVGELRGVGVASGGGGAPEEPA